MSQLLLIRSVEHVFDNVPDLITYLVKLLGTLQLVVALWLRLVQSGLHVLQLQHAVLQSGLAAFPVLGRCVERNNYFNHPNQSSQSLTRRGGEPSLCFMRGFLNRSVVINYSRLD